MRHRLLDVLAGRLRLGKQGFGIAWVWTLNSDALEIARRAVNQSDEVIAQTGGIKDITLSASRIQKPTAIFRFSVKGIRKNVTVDIILVDGPTWQVERITVDK